mmetsp:Transcript_13995/g.33941  ORF Transcript_13995/g.33941 Transcript_13995/m.33941 type:complete len:356 (+) Transcript_13995:71-1138(+)
MVRIVAFFSAALAREAVTQVDVWKHKAEDLASKLKKVQETEASRWMAAVEFERKLKAENAKLLQENQRLKAEEVDILDSSKRGLRMLTKAAAAASEDTAKFLHARGMPVENGGDEAPSELEAADQEPTEGSNETTTKGPIEVVDSSAKLANTVGLINDILGLVLFVMVIAALILFRRRVAKLATGHDPGPSRSNWANVLGCCCPGSIGRELGAKPYDLVIRFISVSDIKGATGSVYVGVTTPNSPTVTLRAKQPQNGKCIWPDKVDCSLSRSDDDVTVVVYNQPVAGLITELGRTCIPAQDVIELAISRSKTNKLPVRSTDSRVDSREAVAMLVLSADLAEDEAEESAMRTKGSM